MPGKIIPSAEPFFFKGNEIGCLLMHGFTGTPKEMRWLGEFLAERGLTVLGVRLAGHATSPEDLMRTRWPDWLASAEDGYHQLTDCTSQIFLLGLSMGGALSLLLASMYPIQGVVAMSTPNDLPPDPRLKFIRWLQYFYPFIPGGESDWHDKHAEAVHTSYGGYPTRSLIEVQKLLAEMRASLPVISAPTLLMHSRNDGGITPENMEKIYLTLGCTDKEMLWFEDSGHVLTRDAERENVFRAAAEFIEKHTNLGE